MRTNIEIDEDLIRQVMAATGLPTKRAAVNEALRLLMQWTAQQELLKMAGKIDWVEGYDPEQSEDDHQEW